MKQLILTALLVLFVFITNAQTRTTYTEFNAGISTGIIPVFPGASSLVGATVKYPSGFIVDYEGGLAFPTLITGKVGVGLPVDHNMDLTIGIRAFPSSIYAQILVSRPNKKSDLVFTAEALTWSNSTLGQYSVLTVGWRFNNENKIFGWKNKLTNKQ